MLGVITVVLTAGGIHYRHEYREELTIRTEKQLDRPLNWLTDTMYEKSRGYHRRGDTQYYVSSGLGIWGPKIRIGTRSEYLVLRIEPRLSRSSPASNGS